MEKRALEIVIRGTHGTAWPQRQIRIEPVANEPLVVGGEIDEAVEIVRRCFVDDVNAWKNESRELPRQLRRQSIQARIRHSWLIRYHQNVRVTVEFEPIRAEINMHALRDVVNEHIKAMSVTQLPAGR